MENNSDNKIIDNIYTSYGPMIGKACSNTNFFDNIQNNDSVTSYISEVNNLSPLLNNNSVTSPKEIYKIKNSPIISKLKPNNASQQNINPKTTNIKLEELSNNKSNLIKLSKKSLKTSDVSFPLTKNNRIDQNNETEESTEYFFNYKVGIFGYKISIWVLILILIAFICIGFLIYKYCYLPNNIVSLKQINHSEKTNDQLSNIENLSDLIESDTNTSGSSSESKSNVTNTN